MEIVKSDLEKEIAAIFKKHTKKGRESDVAGVINGVLREYFRQLKTGNWSEEYPTTGYMQQVENKDAAANVIEGFIWAMDAAGLISSEKRREMQDQLSALRFPEHKVTYAMDYEEIARKAAEQQGSRAADEEAEAEKARCRNCENYQPYEPDAGLREGCTADELYADENCQEIIPEVNKEIAAYMRKSGEGCPYFINAAAGKGNNENRTN